MTTSRFRSDTGIIKYADIMAKSTSLATSAIGAIEPAVLITSASMPSSAKNPASFATKGTECATARAA